MKPKSSNPFPTLPAKKLLDGFSAAVYINVPEEPCTLLFGSMFQKTYSVPIEVARMIHRQIGRAIHRAERISEYKVTMGCNPQWPYDV